MRSATFAAAVAALPSAMAAYQGFNYGSTFNDGSVKVQSDFESAFTTAQGLVGTDGAFTSARLYTMIQGSTTNTPISAIPAAIKTKTSLLLGLWCSAGDAIFANELAALKSAISTYGSELSELVVGISVGSEDLYRISPTGIKAQSDPGVNPDVLVKYIKEVREAISGTVLAGASIGHVDTWTAWYNGSNSAVIDSVDWLGVDAYPYFQDTESNSIENGKALLAKAISNTESVAGGKSIWITETGWPVSGKQYGDAVASTANAKTYWDTTGCPLFGNTNVWWYTLQDASPTTPNPSFGVVGSTLSTTPLFDLSCKSVSSSTSSSTTKTTAATTKTTKATTATGSSTTKATATGSSTTTIAAGSGSGSGSKSSAGSAAATTVSTVSAAASGKVTETGSTATAAASTTASIIPVVGSGSGAGGYNATVTAGSGSGAAGTGFVSATKTGTSATASSTVVAVSKANTLSGSIGAAFAAVMVAILTL